MSDIEETAKATQEVAKATNKALEVCEKFGVFISKYIGGTLEQGFGIWQDKFKYRRFENQLDFIEKVNQKIKNKEIESFKQLELKIAIPLLEASSLEDNDELKDLWINLLVNSINNNNNFNLERVYISVLEQLSALDAKILLKIYETNFNEEISYNIKTYDLPNNLIYNKQEDIVKNIAQNFKNGLNGTHNKKKNDTITEPTDDVKLSLSNLARLKCINLALTFGGESYATIYPTIFGKKLYQAVQ